MVRRIGGQTMAILLWLVAVVVGSIALIQTYEVTRLLAALTMPFDPMETVTSTGRLIFVSQVLLIVLALAWFIGVILLLNRYTKAAETWRRLAVNFTATMAIELVVLGLTTALLYWLPRWML